MFENFFLTLFRPKAHFLVSLLKKRLRRTGMIPHFYFHTFAEVFPQSAYELLVFRKNNEGLEVLLEQRPAEDADWPGQWHFHGTVTRTGDTEEKIWNRLKKELHVEQFPKEPVLAYVEITQNSRCTTMHAMHYMLLPEDVKVPVGKFFPVSKLPEPILSHQPAQIKRLADFVEKL